MGESLGLRGIWNKVIHLGVLDYFTSSLFLAWVTQDHSFAPTLETRSMEHEFEGISLSPSLTKSPKHHSLGQIHLGLTPCAKLGPFTIPPTGVLQEEAGVNT